MVTQALVDIGNFLGYCCCNFVLDLSFLFLVWIFKDQVLSSSLNSTATQSCIS